jgi:hypothetical protein
LSDSQFGGAEVRPVAISELTQLIIPPAYPLQADDGEAFRPVERFLGLPLPADYLDLARRYGTGCFGDKTFYFWVDNPLRPRSAELLEHEIAFWRDCRRRFPAEYAYDLFPARPGYLPWGADVDCGRMGWLTQGSPDSWPVVAKARDGGRFEVFEMSVTTFLAKALAHEIRPDVWRPDFPEDVNRVTFVPGEHYHRSVGQRV